MDSSLLIVGGGLAAQRCCETLRAAGDDRPITIAGAEAFAPYDRPPLSKELLLGEGSSAFRPEGWYRSNGIALRLGVAATSLDPARRIVGFADGSALRYDELLIATGAAPRMLPAFEGHGNVQALRTSLDAERLCRALASGGPLAVIGAGLIGLEAAAAARRRGVDVTVVEAAPRPLAGVLGPRAGAWLTALHRAEGVVVRTGATVERVRTTLGSSGGSAIASLDLSDGGGSAIASLDLSDGGGSTIASLDLSDGARVECAHVLVGVGVRPAADWLAGSGVDPSRVDAAGRTGVRGVFAAGDVTGGGHWEAASRGGAAVAGALLGRPDRLPGPPSFWSDQHAIRLQCVGDPRDAEERGDLTARSFELDHLRDGRVTAVLLADRPPSALRAARARLHVPETLARSAA